MELWRETYGKYEISSEGRVRSKITHKKNKIIKPFETKNGYLRIRLYTPKRKGLLIHRLVAEAFLENENNFDTVNHIDGNKKNNSVENLEWCSQQNNVKLGWMCGQCSYDYHPELGNKRYVEQYDLNGNYITKWETVVEAAKIFNMKHPHKSKIYEVCNGKRNSAHGYIWKYVQRG